MSDTSIQQDKELRDKIYAAVYPQCRLVERSGGSGSSLFTVDEQAVNSLTDDVLQLIQARDKEIERRAIDPYRKAIEAIIYVLDRDGDMPHTVKAINEILEELSS